MIKPLSFAAILMAVLNDNYLRVRSQDPEYCMKYREGGSDWFSPQDTYCCKDCCLTTLSQASQCTKKKCKRCPKHDEGQCTTHADVNTGEVITNGCKENQFCTQYADGENGGFKCKDKLQNNATCNNHLECLSDMCYLRQSQRNFCYGCIAGDNPNKTDTYQLELTQHCNSDSEWCDDQTYSCKAKLDNGMNCPGNNHSCKSKNCHPKLNVCVACLDNSECSRGLSCSERGHCEVVKKDVGEKCKNTDECVDDHVCVEGRCKGYRTIGMQCDTHYHCESNYCHKQTNLCADDPSQSQGKKISPLSTILAAITSTVLVIAVIWLCYRFYKKRKGLRSKNSIKSSKQLAEELFSPEGQKRNQVQKKKVKNPQDVIATVDGEDDDDEDDILNTNQKLAKIEKYKITAGINDDVSVDNSISKDYA